MTFTIRRPAARCVLLDRDDRILLIRAEDPVDPHKPEWLEIPGGGIGVGESSEDACRRELIEETGIDNAEIGPVVWTQRVAYTFAGIEFRSRERIHVARCDGGEFAPAGLEALEAAAFIEARWFTAGELDACSAPTVPARLREFLPALLAEFPASPIDISPRPGQGF